MARGVVTIGIVAVALGLGPAGADTIFSTKNSGSIFKRQTKVLDERASIQYRNSVRLQPNPVHVPGMHGIPGYQGSYKGVYLDAARAAARRHGIPEDLFLRLVQQESAWNPRAKSHAGAIGLAQLMPGTARKLGVNPHDPHQNLDGGARYLRMMYDKFRTWRLALAAYNAGPQAVERYSGVPPYKETRNYVRKILGS